MEERIDIEELRKQVALLRQKLDDQEIVNDRMLRRTMQKEISHIINRTEIKSIVCSIFSMIMFPAMHFFVGFGWTFSISTSLMMLFCIAATMYIHQPIRRIDLMSANLATVAKEMYRFKRRYDNWLHYVTPTLIIPWLLWACQEYYNAILRDENIYSTDGSNFLCSISSINMKMLITCLPLLIGATIGSLIGYSWHRKVVNSAKSIIMQIEE